MTGSRASFPEKLTYKLHLEGLSARLREKRISRMIASISNKLVSNFTSPFLDNEANPANEKVFVFWAQGESEMPISVRACYDSIKRMCGERNVIFLDMNNMGEWVALPSFVLSKLQKGALSITHFSDILRFCLLEKYGGWWLDATIYLANALPSVKSLFSVKSFPTKDFISEGRWSGFIWHMPKGYPLADYMKRFLLFWWSQPDAILPDYFFMDYCIRWFYQNNKPFRNQIDALPFSNPDMYFFQSPICERPFDAEEWLRISSGTTFFKTTYKQSGPTIPDSFRATILTPSSND